MNDYSLFDTTNEQDPGVKAQHKGKRYFCIATIVDKETQAASPIDAAYYQYPESHNSILSLDDFLDIFRMLYRPFCINISLAELVGRCLCCLSIL